MMLARKINRAFTISLTCLVLLVSHSSSANEVTTSWLNEASSQTRLIAADLLKTSELPTEQLVYHLSYNYRIKDGKVNQLVRRVEYIPSFAEAESSGNQTVYWDPDVEQLTIREAGVITAAGSYHRMDKRNIRVVDSTGYNTFTNEKEVVLPLSGLQDRSIVVLEYEISYALDDLESHWSTTIYPVLFSDVKEFQFDIAIDDSFPIRWHISHPDIDCQELANGLQCNANNLAAYKTDAGVLWRDVLGHLVVAQDNSWSDIVDHTLQAFDAAEIMDPAVVALINELTDSDMDIKEKIAAAHEFAARQIRYVSMSELGHRITPHTASSVIENRFGDCKDKSALLTGMLRALGLRAFPVLVATERRNLVNMDVPSSAYFDHMVVCIPDDKRMLCLDATDSYTNWQVTSSTIQGRAALALMPGVTDMNPINLPAADQLWRLKVNTNLSFDAQAAQTETVEREYFGEYAGWLRGKTSGLNKADLNDWLVAQYQGAVTDMVTPEFETTGMTDLVYSTRLKSSAKYDPFLEIEADLDYVEKDYWLEYELKDLLISTEHYDANVAGLKLQSIVTVDFGGIWDLTMLPPKLSLQGRFGEMVRTATPQGDGTVKIQTTASIGNQVVSKQDIESFNDFIGLLVRESQMIFTGSKM